MRTAREYLQEIVDKHGSDMFIVAGSPVKAKIDGAIVAMDPDRVLPDGTSQLVTQIYELAGRDKNKFLESGDDDFAFTIGGLARFRINAYMQRNSEAAVIRVIHFDIPDYKELDIPDEVMNLADVTSGLILITGTAGSGKSTTSACIIDKINREKTDHIITLEDPVEYLHRHQKSIVSQREISLDAADYNAALRASLRQAPDVILLGEMRDYETIRTAMTAAETGHLVIGTLHTKGAVNTIDRIIDSFPPDQQTQVRVQLSMVLHTVVSQYLIPSLKGGMVPAFEIMHMNTAIRSMIRDNKSHQIDNAIAAGSAAGMISMDQSLLKLYKGGFISKEDALMRANNYEQLARFVNGGGI